MVTKKLYKTPSIKIKELVEETMLLSESANIENNGNGDPQGNNLGNSGGDNGKGGGAWGSGAAKEDNSFWDFD